MGSAFASFLVLAMATHSRATPVDLAVAPVERFSDAVDTHAPLVDEGTYLSSEERYVYAPLKRAQPIERAPNSVQVLTGEAIRRSGARNLGELLRQMPEIQGGVLSSAETSVDGARGVGGAVTLFRFVDVRVDGRSVRQEWLGAVLVEPLALFLADVDRIEIVRGPSTALYGGSGLNLMIDIRTRSPEKAQGTLVEVVGHAPTTGMDATAIHGFALGSLWSKVSLGYRQIDEFEPAQAVPDDGNGTATDQFRLSSRSTLDLGAAGSFDLQLGFTYGSFDQIVGVPLAFLDASERSAMLRYHHDWKLGELAVEASWSQFGSRVAPPLGPESRTLDADTVVGEVRQSAPLPLDQTLDAGVSYQLVVARGELFAERSELDRFSVFLTDEIEIAPGWILSGGLRGELLHPSGDRALPAGSLIWQPNAVHSVRLSGGTAVSMPSMLGLAGNFDLGPALSVVLPELESIPLVFRGASDLGPQHLTSVELGYRFVDGAGRVSIGLDAYLQTVEGLGALGTPRIRLAHDPLQLGLEVRPVNRYDYEVAGGELSVGIHPISWLTIGGTYALAHVYDERDALTGGPSTIITNVTPEHRGVFTLRLDFRRGPVAAPWLAGVDVGLQYAIGSDVQSPGLGTQYALPALGTDPIPLGHERFLSARVGWEAITDRVTVALEGWNLLDEPLPLWGDGTRMVSIRTILEI